MVSDSPGLADFAVGLVNSVLNSPEGQVRFFGEFKLQKSYSQSCSSKFFWGQVEMTFGLVNVSYNLPQQQAVKLTFFVP